MNLVVGNTSRSQKDLEIAQSKFKEAKFEQLDRIPMLNLEKCQMIHSLTAFHPNNVLAAFSKCLLPNGTLEFSEIIATEYAYSSSTLRTLDALLGELIINGFVNTTTTLEKPDSSSDHVMLCKVTTHKPNYALGSGVKLSFKKKTKEPVPEKNVVWTINADDDDEMHELEDEELLLDEADLALPSTVAPDCSKKKKACKDCTCGRAEKEEEEEDLSPKITVVERKIVTSSCGSVYISKLVLSWRCV
jgi:hypothetical protein